MNIILGFAFGNRGKYGPGLTNWSIARHIADHYSKGCIIAVQHEIGAALRGLGIKPHFEVKEHGQKSGAYLDTVEVARQLKNFCNTMDDQDAEIYVVAHQDHMDRVVNVLLKSGFHTLTLTKHESPYDPYSHQIWTRSRRLFKFREWLAYPYYVLTGQA